MPGGRQIRLIGKESMLSESNKKLVRRLYEAFWNRADWSLADEILRTAPAPYLERMGLAAPETLAEKIAQRMMVAQLAAEGIV